MKIIEFHRYLVNHSNTYDYISRGSVQSDIVRWFSRETIFETRWNCPTTNISFLVYEIGWAQYLIVLGTGSNRIWYRGSQQSGTIPLQGFEYFIVPYKQFDLDDHKDKLDVKTFRQLYGGIK